MAEELQQLINKRNIDYGIADTNGDNGADAGKPPAADAQLADAELADAELAHAELANAEAADGSNKLIAADIARWIAERGDIAELGQIYRPHADHRAPDLADHYASGLQSDLSLLHWRHAATPVQDHDESNQRTKN